MPTLFHSTLMMLLAALPASAATVSGLWDGTAKVADGLSVPLHLEIIEANGKLQGALKDGEQKTLATQADTNGNGVTLKFAHYATTLQLTLDHQSLSGNYSKDNGAFSYPVELKRHTNAAVVKQTIPRIAGVWIIPTESPKGEHAWRLIIHQTGSTAAATILRIDGDTGTLAGQFSDGSFHLSHFQDTRPAVLEITPVSDGSLELRLAGPHVGAKPGVTEVSLVAVRATSKGAPKPDDAEGHTSVKDPTQPFQFHFPDLTGKTVSNTDSQFKDKVVLVNITGSWCPNCHDEAPYLEDLYQKYHRQGLEIVALDFEEPDQKQTLARLHAFLQKYGITYTYLLAGEPAQLVEKVPQAVNLNAWPTSFLLGKDGRVRFVETGFPSPGSAAFYTEARHRYAENIEHLLAAPARNAAQ